MAKIGRQQLGVTLADGSSWTVWTAPLDDDLRAATARKHSWPSPQDNPVGYLAFLAWSAGRRHGLHTLTWESFLNDVTELEVVEEETVPPTPPEAGDG